MSRLEDEGGIVGMGVDLRPSRRFSFAVDGPKEKSRFRRKRLHFHCFAGDKPTFAHSSTHAWNTSGVQRLSFDEALGWDVWG